MLSRPSVVCLSVCLSVGSARTPYSGSCNFRQYFYGIRYAGNPLTSTKNFTEIVQGELLRRVGELNTTGVAKYSKFGPIEGYISDTVQDKGSVLITNRKSHMSFRWPWMTLNGVMAVILRYFTELVYDVVVKQLSVFQNLFLIVYDHSKTTCVVVQRLFWQNKLW